MGTFIVALGSSRGSISDPALAWLLPTRGSVCSGANVSGVAVIIAKMLTRLNPSAEPLRQEFFWTDYSLRPVCCRPYLVDECRFRSHRAYTFRFGRGRRPLLVLPSRLLLLLLLLLLR